MPHAENCFVSLVLELKKNPDVKNSLFPEVSSDTTSVNPYVFLHREKHFRLCACHGVVIQTTIIAIICMNRIRKTIAIGYTVA